MNVPTSLVSEERDRLADAIVAGVGTLPAWRVHRYPPNNVASPCIYLDVPNLQQLPDSIVAEWPVVLVIDGTAPAQLLSFDLAIAAVWDALNTLDRVVVTAAFPAAKDVGGPNQRVYTLSVSSYLVAQTLCLPALSEVVPAT